MKKPSKDTTHKSPPKTISVVGRVPRVMGSKTDDLEKAIQKEIHEVQHIDLEIN